MSSNKPFQRVSSLSPRMSAFDLSYTKTFTADMGQLIPIMCDEVVPGDIFKIGNQAVLRFQPLLAPILHEVNLYTHYFFVPYRLLWDNWENFITGGKLGDDESELPTWSVVAANVAKGTLWDYFGFPTGVVPTRSDAEPCAFPKNAYNMIWNEYYRDETLQSEVSLNQNDVLLRNWEKDYFTSSLPWQQRGTPLALPISGTTHAHWDGDAALDAVSGATGPFNNMQYESGTFAMNMTGTVPAIRNSIYVPQANLNDNTVDLGVGTTFNVADLRLAFQVQKWMERNARSGYRYTEFLHSHFGTSPRDDRLQRPEYIGGSKSPVIVSEVLQTSSTDAASPQGNMSGHGISVSQTYCGKYRATEFGLIMGIMSVMPRTMYQQGFNRQWLRRTKYDFYMPEFANLSEQAITNNEIYATGDPTLDNGIFGYQGRFDEMRTKQNLVCGHMRDTFDYWHLGRKFSSNPGLTSSFISCNPTSTKRIFAVQSEPGLMVQFANLIKAWRPMPIQSDPGFIDHN